MEVIILAAGIGSRLGENEQPKTLTLLANGETILGLQLKTFARFLPMGNINVVVGYHEEQIIKRYPQLKYVHNLNYAHENTSKSLLKAITPLQTDVLWINGDVVFHPDVLETLLSYDRTSMIVNEGPVGNEEVKYRTDSQGKILKVSKQVQNPKGEALGINYFKKSDLESLKIHLQACKPNDYFEKGIEGCIQDGIQVWAATVPTDHCCEIDFPEDLEKANVMLNSF